MLNLQKLVQLPIPVLIEDILQGSCERKVLLVLAQHQFLAIHHLEKLEVHKVEIMLPKININKD